MVEGGIGTAESKIEALRGAGAYIAEKPEDLSATLERAFK